MVDYREILRLKSLGLSNVAIGNSVGSSRNKVSEVLSLAEAKSLVWPIPETLTNQDLEQLFYPERGCNEGRKLPDFEYIYNELAKPGVTLSLLWLSIVLIVKQIIQSLISIRSSMTSIMLMQLQRKQLFVSSISPVKSWK